MTWQGTGPSGYFLTPNIDATTGRVDWEPPRGDVSGVVDALIVIGLQGFPVSNQTPVSGNVLQYDGTQWIPGAPVVVSGVATPHNLLSSTHSDTVPASPTAGDIIAGSGAPADWVRFPVGECGQVLSVNDGGSLVWDIPGAKVDIISSGTVVDLDECSHKVIINGASGSPILVNLPTSPRLGQEIIIKDGAGTSNVNNIEVTGSGTTIDGRLKFVLSNNYQALCLTYIGTEWSIV